VTGSRGYAAAAGCGSGARAPSGRSTAASRAARTRLPDRVVDARDISWLGPGSTRRRRPSGGEVGAAARWSSHDAGGVGGRRADDGRGQAAGETLEDRGAVRGRDDGGGARRGSRGAAADPGPPRERRAGRSRGRVPLHARRRVGAEGLRRSAAPLQPQSVPLSWAAADHGDGEGAKALRRRDALARVRADRRGAAGVPRGGDRSDHLRDDPPRQLGGHGGGGGAQARGEERRRRQGACAARYAARRMVATASCTISDVSHGRVPA